MQFTINSAIVDTIRPISFPDAIAAVPFKPHATVNQVCAIVSSYQRYTQICMASSLRDQENSRLSHAVLVCVAQVCADVGNGHTCH